MGAEDDHIPSTRVSWHLGKARLCFETMCHLLQIGAHKTKESCNLKLPGHRKALGRSAGNLKPKRGPKLLGLKTRWIDAFFVETYQSAGHIEFIV